MVYTDYVMCILTKVIIFPQLFSEEKNIDRKHIDTVYQHLED